MEEHRDGGAEHSFLRLREQHHSKQASFFFFGGRREYVAGSDWVDDAVAPAT